MPSCVCVNARVIKLTNTTSFNDFAAGFDEHLPKLDRLKGHRGEGKGGLGGWSLVMRAAFCVCLCCVLLWHFN